MKPTTLTYTSPANEWIEGFPLGNGVTGLMLYEKEGNKIFSLNFDRLWRRNKAKTFNTASIIPTLRRLVQEGKADEAEKIFNENTSRLQEETNAYQPFFDLILINRSSKYKDYKRELNLNSAISTMEYSIDQSTYKDTAFVSGKYDIAVIKLNCDKMFDCKLSITREVDEDCSYTVGYDKNLYAFTGRFVERTTFVGLIDIDTTNGTSSYNDGVMDINGTNEVIIKIALSTSLNSVNPYEDCLCKLNAVKDIPCIQILNEHTQQFMEKFNRVCLDLNANTTQTTEQMYNNIFMQGGIDNAMYKQLFDMARYLVLSSSRPSSLPINLQGIWNKDVKPMWECGYTMDMNVQMAYWLVMPCNLFESELPLFDWINGLMPTMKKQCMDIFGIDGVHIPQYTDAWLVPTKWDWAGVFQVLWSGAAAWIARHYMEYWRYTGNDDFLIKQAYPFMRECAKFYKGFVAKNEDGKYIVCPTCSPENRTANGNWLVNTATMDISLIEELMGNLIYINDKFNLNDSDRAFWEDVKNNIVKYPINQNGCLEEWIEDSEQGDLGHRHISHIYGIFPGDILFEKGKEHIYNAAVKALYRRREAGFGSFAMWSHAWNACCFSRIGEGDTALSCINDLMETGMISNYLTTHNDWRDGSKSNNSMIPYKLFQIDAILGATAAIAEMFIQSNREYIRILPSLPTNWSEKGSITGLRAYGGVEVDITWEDDVIKTLKLISHNGGKVKFEICTSFEYVATTNLRTNTPVEVKVYHNIVELDTQKSDEVLFQFKV